MVANFASWQNNYATPQPNIGPNDNRGGLHRMIGVYRVIITIVNCYKVANSNVVADFNALVCDN
jgi:hypothetical protein